MRLVPQFLRFAIVGLLNTLIDYGLFNLLLIMSGVRGGAGLALMNAAAITAAALNSYCFNRRWTFSARSGQKKGEVFRFAAATGAGVVINSLTVLGFSQLAAWLPVDSIILLNLGKAAGAVFSAVWNFSAYRRWVFVAPDHPAKLKSDWQPGRISVIIPAYNEANRLPERLRLLAADLQSQDLEIWIVDDGSTDQTCHAIQDIIAQYDYVHCCSYRPNRGKGAAVRTGMALAGGEFLIYTDADQTFTAAHIREVAEQLRRGHPIVIGCRAKTPKQRLDRESWLGCIRGRIFNTLVQMLLLPGFQDTQCGLKGFHRSAAEQIFSRQTLDGFAFDVELLSIARVRKIPVLELSIAAQACEGSRISRLLDPVKMARDLFMLAAAQTGSPLRNMAQETLLVLLIFLTALAVRIPWLWLVPRFVDELNEVKLGYLISIGKALPLHNVAWDIGAMHNYILSLLFTILGPGIYWPRLYSAVVSALSVVVIYVIGRRLFSRRVGLLAAGLLAANGMNILVSHMAWSNSTTTFFFALALLATINAEQKKSGPWLAAAGLAWALVLQTHASVIIYVVCVGCYVLRLSFRKTTRIDFRWYAAAAGAFCVGYLNMIWFNLSTAGGSFRYIARKTYALEDAPGIASFADNIAKMAVELIRAVSACYRECGSLAEYMGNPLFLLGIVLLAIGIREAFRMGVRLPVWMIISAFAVLPWINQRYVFYLSTRYIMPVVFCAVLLCALALDRIGGWLTAGFLRQKREAVPAVLGALVLMALQIVPFYQYCARLTDTNQSNKIAMDIMRTAIGQPASAHNMILLDPLLPLENKPLAVLMTTAKVPCLTLSPESSRLRDAETWRLHLNGPNRVRAVVSSQTFRVLRLPPSLFSVRRFHCHIPHHQWTETRTVFYIENRKDLSDRLPTRFLPDRDGRR